MVDLYIPSDPQALTDEIDLRLFVDPSAPQLVDATVASVSPTAGTCTVTMPSSTTVTAMPWHAAYTPAVGDAVWLFQRDKVFWILGTPFRAAGGGLTGRVTWTRAAAPAPGELFANGGAIPAQHTGLIALVGANTPSNITGVANATTCIHI